MIETPFDRWGLILDPPEAAGSNLLVERETDEGWKVQPPGDAVRIWARHPGTAADDGRANWTVWIHEHQLAGRLSTYNVDEWLPIGVEPDWA